MHILLPVMFEPIHCYTIVGSANATAWNSHPYCFPGSQSTSCAPLDIDPGLHAEASTLCAPHPSHCLLSQAGKLGERLSAKDLQLQLDEGAPAFLADFDPAFGARPMKRAIQRKQESPLATVIPPLSLGAHKHLRPNSPWSSSCTAD